MLKKASRYLDHLKLPKRAKEQYRQDNAGTLYPDPGPEMVIHKGVQWLKRAQDMTASGDNGVSRSFSLISGWATSYPETTGYIVPTMIEYGKKYGDDDAIQRARRMADWLVSIQLEEGGFQGGKIDASPVVPVTFNTGQILIGLAAAEAEFGGYKDALKAAADWLVKTQDADGCWRSKPTPYAAPGEKAYETHVSWGLFEAERVMPGHGYGKAGLNQVRWAITKQTDNGWIDDCCLTHANRPLTHTLGYALRGIVEAFLLSKDKEFLNPALKTAKGLQSALRDDGYLPGRLKADWSTDVNWVCLTGIAQIAHSWLLLAEITEDEKMREAAKLANSYVRKTIVVDGDPDICGGVKGSYPVNGSYGKYEFLNWAVKFCIDSNLCELSNIN